MRYTTPYSRFMMPRPRIPLVTIVSLLACIAQDEYTVRLCTCSRCSLLGLIGVKVLEKHGWTPARFPFCEYKIWHLKGNRIGARVCLSSNWAKDWPPALFAHYRWHFFHQGEGDVALQLAPPFLSSLALLVRTLKKKSVVFATVLSGTC